MNKFFTRPITVMMIPHSSARPVKMTVSHVLLITLITGWISMVGAAVYIHRQKVIDAGIKDTNRILVNHSCEVLQEASKSRQLINELKSIESRLLNILSFKNKKDFVESYDVSTKYMMHKYDLGDLLESNLDNSKFSYINEKDIMLLFLPFKKPSIHNDSLLAFSQSPFTERCKTEWILETIGHKYVPVRAVADGKILLAGWQGSAYGHMVMIDHGHGFSTRYGQNTTIMVKVGENVRRGQVIAFIRPKEGYADMKFHYEIWRYGRPIEALNRKEEFEEG